MRCPISASIKDPDQTAHFARALRRLWKQNPEAVIFFTLFAVKLKMSIMPIQNDNKAAKNEGADQTAWINVENYHNNGPNNIEFF